MLAARVDIGAGDDDNDDASDSGADEQTTIDGPPVELQLATTLDTTQNAIDESALANAQRDANARGLASVSRLDAKRYRVDFGAHFAPGSAVRDRRQSAASDVCF